MTEFRHTELIIKNTILMKSVKIKWLEEFFLRVV